MTLTLSASLAASMIVAAGLPAHQFQPIAHLVACVQQESEPGTSQPRRVRISGGVMAGQLRTHVNPVYPEEARNSAVGGTVVLHVIVGADGTVQRGRCHFGASSVSAPGNRRSKTMDLQPIPGERPTG